ncbi:MAG: universal stress protein [Gemmatimonadota bacterium]
MPGFHRILYPTDFSDCARRALPRAVQFAREWGAELHLLHAIVLHAVMETDRERLAGALVEEAERQLERLTDGGVADGVRIVPAVRRGISTAPVILEYAAEHDVDLIVMGSHGRRGLRRFFLGSVAEEVTRVADAPVLIIGKHEDPAAADTAIRRIVVPVDFSSHCDLALEYAARLADRLGADIVLLHVVEQVLYPDFYVPITAAGIDVAALREEARTRLSKMAERLIASGHEIRVETVVSVGHPAGQIVEFAETNEADLIVMATHGLTGLERALVGSVTERVARRASSSVLVVKPFGKPFPDGA